MARSKGQRLGGQNARRLPSGESRTRISITLDPNVLAFIDQEALDCDRSRAGMIEIIIKNWVLAQANSIDKEQRDLAGQATNYAAIDRTVKQAVRDAMGEIEKINQEIDRQNEGMVEKAFHEGLTGKQADPTVSEMETVEDDEPPFDTQATAGRRVTARLRQEIAEEKAKPKKKRA